MQRLLHLSERSHQGVLIFTLSVSLCVLVESRGSPRAWRTGTGSFFITPPRLLVRSVRGEALSPAICLPAPGIVIPKCGPVNISLVIATSPRPPQCSRKEEKKKSGIEILLASLSLVDLSSILPTFSPLLQLCLQNAAKMVCCFRLVLVFFFSQLKKKVKQCNLACQMESHVVIW